MLQGMQIVAIESQKGGSGKTLTALNLAVAATLAGKTAAVIDLDPQASAAGWRDTRSETDPVVVAVPSSRLPHAIAAAQESGADLVLLDTAPHVEATALAAARAADLILIPCRPGIFDLRSIALTADLVKLAGKTGVIVLNAIPPGATRIVEDARRAAALHGLDVSPFYIQQRAVYGHALTIGQTAQEYEPSSKAAAEVSDLYNWVLLQLHRITSHKAERKVSNG